MAVYLDNGVQGRADYGDVTIADEVTELSVALTIKTAAASVTSLRLVQKWGAGTDLSFGMFTSNTDELGFSVSDDGTNTFGRQTSGFNLATDTLYRIVITWTVDDINIYINGAQETDVAWLTDAGIATLKNSTASLIVGYDSTNTISNYKGDYSEFAIWNRVLTSAEALEVSDDKSPSYYNSGMVLYDKLESVIGAKDEITNVAPTMTAAVDADHPTIIYPLPRVGGVIRGRRDDRRAPKEPYGVNWDSPQAKGLVGWWPVLDRDRNQLTNLVTGDRWLDSVNYSQLDPGTTGHFTDGKTNLQINPVTAVGEEMSLSIAQSAALGLQITGDMTFSMRVKFPSLGSINMAMMVCGGENDVDGTENLSWQIFVEGTTDLLKIFWEYGSGANVTVSSTLAMASGAEHLVTVRRDVAAKTVDFFLDGEEDLGVSYTNNPTGGSAGWVILGASTSGVHEVDMEFGDVRINDVALPLSAIRARHAGQTTYDLYDTNDRTPFTIQKPVTTGGIIRNRHLSVSER